MNIAERISLLVSFYGMQPHPEGGYYTSTYSSAGSIPQHSLPETFKGDRPFSTAILFLLTQGTFSAFHRIQSDECWHFYEGGKLLIHCIYPDGRLDTIILGTDILNNEKYQFVVPAGTWFASEPAPGTGYALTGCTVSPGFHFDEFELAEKNKLAAVYPQHTALISRLTR